MIRVSGSSYNNGISFVGSKYNVSFVTKKVGTTFYIKENIANRNGKCMQLLDKIPFLRGVVSVIGANKLLLAILLCDVLLNIILPHQNADNINVVMPVAIALVIMFIVEAVILVYFISKIFVRMRCTWQYHGAEHKVIFTNYDNKEITFVNCKSSPRVSEGCGTMLVSIMLAMWIILKLILIVFNIYLWSAFEIIIVIAVSYELFLMKRDTPVLSIFFKVGYWMQKYFFTSEPTNEQLLQAITAFKLLERAENNELTSKEFEELTKEGMKINIK